MTKFTLITIIFVAAIGGFLFGRYSISLANFQTAAAKDAKKLNFIKVSRDEKITGFQRLGEVDDEQEFFGVVRQTDADSANNSRSQFSVYDEAGKVRYEIKDSSVESFRTERLTRRNSQILVETNDGGTDDFLRVVDYRNGKFSEIIDSGETQMRGGFWSMPEYRSGMKNPYFAPDQIFVINQNGGADENPSAAVFRYKNGKYQKVGVIKMQTLGDFIEKQIAADK